MGTYAPMTESLREMNRLLIESNQWDAQQKQAEQQFGLQKMQLESQLKTQQQQQEMNSMKLQEMKEDMTPQTFNAFNFLTDNTTTRKMLFEVNGGAFGQELAGSLQQGAKLNADGTFTGADGQPIQLSKKQFDRVAPALYSIATKYDDPEFEIQNNISDLDNQVSSLTQQLGKMPDRDVRLLPQRAKLLAERSKLQGQIGKYYEETAPDKILGKLRQNYANLQQYAVASATLGNNPQLNNVISNAATHLNGRIKSIEDNIMAEKLAEVKANKSGTNGQLELAFILDANDNIIGSKYIPVKKGGAGQTPYEADPTLDTKQKIVWAPQIEKQQYMRESMNKAEKVRMDAIRRNFYDETGLVLRGPLDGLKERIAQVEHDDKIASGWTKGKRELEIINESVKYPEMVLKDFDGEVKRLQGEAMKNPIFQAKSLPEQKAFLTKIQENMDEKWFNKYGFPTRQYRNLMAKQQELQNR